jgi:5-oxoprolinase (ATP-hydrolysing) subunit A
MQSIDLNCDMGESFGAFTIGNDEALMDYISSANIACGFHGGDPSVMRKTVALAVSKNVSIGAHPGYADLQGFGRRQTALSPPEVYDITVYQVGALMGFAKAAGAIVRHVKPHGALYNTAAQDTSIAAAIAKAVYDIDKGLILYGLSGSRLIDEGKKSGLRTVSEVFADRTYQDDGSLTSRTSSDALITDPAKAASQVLQMVQRRTVTSTSGKEIPVVAETVCIHGDGANAFEFAKAIAAILKTNHVGIQHP